MTWEDVLKIKKVDRAKLRRESEDPDSNMSGRDIRFHLLDSKDNKTEQRKKSGLENTSVKRPRGRRARSKHGPVTERRKKPESKNAFRGPFDLGDWEPDSNRGEE
tara:strand:- start:49 stop:363 length:315 start_codon:yes stop_codon:yes gene_type:complete